MINATNSYREMILHFTRMMDIVYPFNYFGLLHECSWFYGEHGDFSKGLICLGCPTKRFRFNATIDHKSES